MQRYTKCSGNKHIGTFFLADSEISTYLCRCKKRRNMRHEHLKCGLELMLLLTQNKQYRVDDICEKLGISRRNFYYYIDFFVRSGFNVEKNGRCYSLSKSSKFFQKLYDLVQLRDDEVAQMRRLIEDAGLESGSLKGLYHRLDRFYDFKTLGNEQLQQRVVEMRDVISDAIRRRTMVRIAGYSSPNSHTVTDRVVEPFMFLNNNKDVRCYEISSGTNKTFRLSRMTDVERLDTPWKNAPLHRQAYTDLFAFSGEKTMRITLIMGQLSHNVMLEEYPESAACFVRNDDGRWFFRTDVCSYLGIGRFVLGMYDDVEMLGDEGLKEYVTTKLRSWCDNLKK